MSHSASQEFLDFFAEGSADEIEAAMLQADLGVVVDWDEEDEIIVLDFADFVGSELSCRRTSAGDLEVIYKERSATAQLRGENKDRERIVQAIHSVLTPDWEFRLLRSCLGTDTLCYIVEKPAMWQAAEESAPELLDEIFLPYSYKIGFDYTEE